MLFVQDLKTKTASRITFSQETIVHFLTLLLCCENCAHHGCEGMRLCLETICVQTWKPAQVFVSLSTLYIQHATRFRLETRLRFYCHALMGLSQATSTTARLLLLQLPTLPAARPTHVVETDLSSWSHIIGWAYFITVRWVASLGAVADNRCVRGLGAVSGPHVVFVLCLSVFV